MKFPKPVSAIVTLVGLFLLTACSQKAGNAPKGFKFVPPDQINAKLEDFGLQSMITLVQAFPAKSPNSTTSTYVFKPGSNDQTDLLGSAEIDETNSSTANLLRTYPRPWTFPKVVEWFHASKDEKTKICFLRTLAAGGDKRALLVLGEVIENNEPLVVRLTACMIVAQSGLGKEAAKASNADLVNTAIEWWKANKIKLEKELL